LLRKIRDITAAFRGFKVNSKLEINVFPVKIMETSSGNVGRSNLPCESASQWAARETDPTPVVTRSSEESRVEPTSSMVLRSHTHGEAVVPPLSRM